MTSTSTLALRVGLSPQRHHLDRRACKLAALPGDDDDLLSTKETAGWLDTSEQWLEIGRSKGYGPPYVRLSPRRIRYRRGTVKVWLQERSHRMTSEYVDPLAPRQGRRVGSRLIGGKVVAPSEADDAL